MKLPSQIKNSFRINVFATPSWHIVIVPALSGFYGITSFKVFIMVNVLSLRKLEVIDDKKDSINVLNLV